MTRTDPHEDLAVETRGLSKHYADPARGTVVAVEGLDFRAHAGEIHGLLGPNGAGKSTTLRILATLLVPTSGSARVAGLDVTADPLAVRQRVGFLSQSTGLYPRLTGREILTTFGVLHGLEGEALTRRIDALSAAFDLGAFLDQRTESLSSGQRQRVNIARAVLHEPRVLILDEPTTGLDILAAEDMVAFVESLRGSRTCVLLSTHILSEAERLCDRIGVLWHGRLLADGTPDELRARTGREHLDQVFRALVEGATDGVVPAERRSA